MSGWDGIVDVGRGSPQFSIEAWTLVSRLFRVMLDFIRSYMGSWSVMWIGEAKSQPFAIPRPTRPPPAPISTMDFPDISEAC